VPPCVTYTWKDFLFCEAVIKALRTTRDLEWVNIRQPSVMNLWACWAITWIEVCIEKMVNVLGIAFCIEVDTCRELSNLVRKILPRFNIIWRHSSMCLSSRLRVMNRQKSSPAETMAAMDKSVFRMAATASLMVVWRM